MKQFCEISTVDFRKSGVFQNKKLIYFAISINRVGLIDNPYCSLNTKRRRMDISAIKKNTSCNDDMITPASKRSTKYYMSYAQIRYLMKRLSTALDSKLKQGRPPKYCRMCHRELCKLIGRQLEREPLEKKYVKKRNITEQRCDKRKNQMQGLPEVIKRKISLGNMKIKIMAFVMVVIQTILMKMMKTNIIPEKKSKFDPWTFFVDGAHSILQDTFNEGVQHIIEKNPDMNTDEAEEVTFDKLEPRYRAEAIGQYKAFLKFSKAMKKDPLHKKITDTAKRLRDEDDFDEDDALKYAIKNEDTSWMGNLKNLTHQPIP